jgi:hypothetical protein
VILVQPVPHFVGDIPGWDPANCSLLTILSTGCTHNVPLELVDRVQASARASVNEASAATGAPIVDPRNLICHDGVCSTERDGTVLYFDAGHISVNASQLLTDDFAEALAQAG